MRNPNRAQPGLPPYPHWSQRWVENSRSHGLVKFCDTNHFGPFHFTMEDARFCKASVKRQEPERNEPCQNS
jgi:hypothetical protein